MTTNPAALAELARCYCLDTSRWKAVEILMLAEWANTPYVPPVITFDYTPDTSNIVWIDKNGNHIGNLLTFKTTAHIPTVSEINASGIGLTSISGLDSLPALVNLYVNNNALTSLDVTGVIGLKQLGCANAILGLSLNCSNNASLQQLDCSLNNTITSLSINAAAPIFACNAGQCNLTRLSVNTILTILAANGQTGGNVSVDTQGGGSPPDAGPPDGAAAVIALLAEVPPWTVSTD